MNESQALKWKNSLSSAAQSIIFPSKIAASTSSTSEAATFQPAALEPTDSQLAAESLPESCIGVSRTLVNVRSDGKEVERSELIEGYHFGSDVVPFRGKYLFFFIPLLFFRVCAILLSIAFT